MQVLFTILYIVLFIVCLSVLIMIHELGHLMAAKAFKVYCFEYSIGFGPALFKKKRKNGETYFSLRAIPFGGYVSMYGEGVEVPEGVEIPPERSLEGVAKWKRGIILVAGVTMNAILAIVIFMISNLCFPVVNYYMNPITVAETSIFADSGVKTGDLIGVSIILDDDKGTFLSWEDIDEDKDYKIRYYVPAVDVTIEYKDGTSEEGAKAILSNQIQGDNKLDWKYFVHFVKLDDNNKEIVKSFEPDKNILNYKFNFDVKCYLGKDENGKATFGDKEAVPVTLPVTVNEKEEYSLGETGISITKDSHYLGAKAFGQTFVDFGTSSTAIVRAFGSLFVSQEARDSVGGIIAIGFETTNILKNFGLNQFLRVWGLVSVNLAIVNLLPFPGLDGWQLLVLVVEGVSKKKIPEKAKNIVSLIGLALLFGLMILLVVKDFMTYIL